jgi:uroporphyrinogen-III synthase
MGNLAGTRVALLEARRSSELAEMVRRQGGEPICAPAVRESVLDCTEDVRAFINSITQGSIEIVIFLTGVGALTLFREAEKLGQLPDLLEALKDVTTVCRGPKPVAALKRTGVHISIVAPEPNTSTELLEAMAHVDLRDKGVAMTHYGERNTFLVEALRLRGARLLEICLYEWLMPEDVQPLRDMVDEVIGGNLDVVAFTSQIQIRHLFQVAEETGRASELTAALNEKVVVASVGPTCTGVLQGFGVEPRIIPDHPKMGHLVLAISEYFDPTGATANPKSKN